MDDFSGLELNPALRQGVDAAGFTAMTPIQAASLPAILSGRDVIAQAKTGSGKTAAFALGLLAALEVPLIRLQGLVLCPTRELAEQVSRDIRQLARFLPNVKLLTLCGGIPLRPQLASLAHEPQLVVGTPGRILDLIRQDALPLDCVRVLVLDEADRMLDMGFTEDLAAITARLPQTRQTLLFSATYSPGVRDLSRQFQRDALEVSVVSTLTRDEVEQRFYEVEESRKFELLINLLGEHGSESTLIFCNTKHDTRALAGQLAERGYAVLALHGDLEQRERDEVLVQFANRSAAVLIATDVAARGLDIKLLPLVVNYDMATDPDIHLHRIGRTGRAGSTGLALSLCTSREGGRARAIETDQGAPLSWRKPGSTRERPTPLRADMITLVIDGGRQDKLRAGDLLGALTGDAGLTAEAVGKIDIYPTRTYVAIQRRMAEQALRLLSAGKIKGRRFRIRQLG